MLRAIFTGFAIFALAAPAVAAPKKKQASPPSSIEIHNQRKVALTAFTLALQGEEKPVAALAKPLAPGAKVRIKLSKAKGCEYMARWEFEDAGDEGQVDLCHDPKIVLTD